MKRFLICIYALAVCFVAVIIFSISIGVVLYDFIEFSAPELTLPSYKYERHQSNIAFLRGFNGQHTDDSVLAQLSEDELSKVRAKSYRVALDVERRNAIQSLLRAFLIIMIDMVLFVLHWKIIRRESSANESKASD